MENLSVASEASKRYILGAISLGLALRAIIEDLRTHGHEHVTIEDVVDFLELKRRFPKPTYTWQNWIVKATEGLNPTGIYPWTAWSSRFILQCKANNETDSAIFAKMRKRGFEIPGENWVEVVLEAHRFIESELARGCDAHDDATLQLIIVRAHDWGYTLPEITRRIFESTNRSASAVNTDVVKRALESNGIPEAQHRNGRYFGDVAMEFVLSAYNLGMDVNNIQDQMYAHGFDLSGLYDLILDLLKRNGIWQRENFDRARRSQAAQPIQPRPRDDVRAGEEQVASRGSQANEGPGGRIRVMDLLNKDDISPRGCRGWRGRGLDTQSET